MVRALIVLLGLSALIDVALGAWAGVAWTSFANQWFPGVSYMVDRDPRLLGFVLACLLFFVAALHLLALIWIKKERSEGFGIATAVGIYLALSAILTFAAFRRTEFLLVDGLRGVLLVVTSLLGVNEPSTVRSLRLPDRSSETDKGPERERGRQGRDRRDGRRERGRNGRSDGRRDRRGGEKHEKRARSGDAGGAKPKPERPAAEQTRVRVGEANEEAKRSLAVVVKGGFKNRPEGGPAEGGRSRRRGRRGGDASSGEALGGPVAGVPGDLPPSEGAESMSDDGGRNRRRRRGGRGRGGRGDDLMPGSGSTGAGSESGAAESRGPESAPSARNDAPRGEASQNELFGLTREVGGFGGASDGASTGDDRSAGSGGEDMFGRTKRADRGRRPAGQAHATRGESDPSE